MLRHSRASYSIKCHVDTIKSNGFALNLRRSNRYPATKIRHVDYADDLALLSDLIRQAGNFLHILVHSTKSIALHVKLYKKYIRLHHNGIIITVSGTLINSVGILSR